MWYRLSKINSDENNLLGDHKAPSKKYKINITQDVEPLESQLEDEHADSYQSIFNTSSDLPVYKGINSLKVQESYYHAQGQKSLNRDMTKNTV